MFKSLRIKLLAMIILITSICTLTFMGISYYEVQNAATSQMKNDGTTLISVVGRDIKGYKLDKLNEIQSVFNEVKTQSNNNISYISIVDKDSKMVVSDKEQKTSTSVNAVSSATETGTTTTATKESTSAKEAVNVTETKGLILTTASGEKVYNVSTPFYQDGNVVGTINIGISLSNMNKLIKYDFIQALLIGLLIAFIAIVIGTLLSRTIANPIKGIVDRLDEFSEGDFTINFESKGRDEIFKLTSGLNSSISGLKGTISGIKQVVIELNGISEQLLTLGDGTALSTKEVSESVTDVFKSISEQNSNINIIAVKLNEFGQTLDNINLKVDNVNESSLKIKDNADIGADKLKELVKTIEEIRGSFEEANTEIGILNTDVAKIEDITGVINNVAKQTSLLALNAGIEAARAGEAGKGFSVVADEIKKLAEQVMLSSKNINNIISIVANSVNEVSKTSATISEKMNKQLNVVEQTVSSFQVILKEVDINIPEMQSICSSLRNTVEEKESIIKKFVAVTDGSKQISDSAGVISQEVEQQLNNIEQLSSSSQTVHAVSEELAKDIRRFKI
jgi:methyl-accepting chemotaxis protein